MPLDSTRLGASIHDKIVAQFGAAKDDVWLTNVCNAIAQAVVSEITANAVVTGPVAVVSVTGVTPGAGTSGAGTGTLNNGTIS